MNKNKKAHTRTRTFGENIITAITVGTVFILIGAIYVATLPTSLGEKIVNFFSSFTAIQVPETTIYLPAPAAPSAHAIVYNAAFQFCLGIAILQIIILLLRIMFRSPLGKTAETFGNMVYWFGASYLVATFLNSTTTVTTWFAFWAAILIALGTSMITRATVLFVSKRIYKQMPCC
ncbi:MAG: hypothetical protein NWE94_01995 [Candidatus Bathyarchaeota archaeon]|nr:hypothetical protein [Candidatus Bathyarchaeota archaeon]